MKTILALLLLLAAPAIGPAHAAEIQVLTAGAYRAVLAAVAPAIQAELGTTLVIRNETAGVVAQKLRDNDPADLAVLPPAAAAAPIAGLIGPLRPLARVGIGVAVREGTPHPAIATEAEVRAAILAARAPAWINPAAGGSSGIYMTALMNRWGIADQVLPHAVLVGGGLVTDAVADGRADLAFQQLSELGHTPGVVVVGPLPPAIQSYTVYAGAVPLRSPHAESATAVLDWLASPRATAALRQAGMEPP